MMELISLLKKISDPLDWFLSIGKGDVEHIKNEIADLLQHSSQSLKSYLELYTVLEDIPREDFSQQTFGPIANHCLWFFTSPDAIQKVRTHCTDIGRDVARIKFKIAKILRTENQDWKGINKAFFELNNSDYDYQNLYEMELHRIGYELSKIERSLNEDKLDSAYNQYVELRKSLTKSCEALSNEISKMQKAQTHIHELLT